MKKACITLALIIMAGILSGCAFFEIFTAAPKTLQDVHGQVGYENWQPGNCTIVTQEYRTRLLKQGYTANQLAIEPRSVYQPNDHVVLIVTELDGSKWLLDKNNKFVNPYEETK